MSPRSRRFLILSGVLLAVAVILALIILAVVGDDPMRGFAYDVH